MSTGGGGAEELSEALLSFYGVAPNNNSENVKNNFFIEACSNEAVDEGIIQCLLDYFPRAIDESDEERWTPLPLHVACYNKNATLGVVKRIIVASENENNHGQSPLLRCATCGGHSPLHILCDNRNVNEKAAIEILMLLLDKYPESIRQANNDGHLPIHFASAYRSPQFCRVLMKSYPDSVRVRGSIMKKLPLHSACHYNTLPTVEYLYKLYPDAAHQTVQGEIYPIHYTILNAFNKNRDTESALEIIRFLLNCDPNVKLQKVEGESLLLLSCIEDDNTDDIDIEAAMQVIQVVYDVHPEAIEDDLLLSQIDYFDLQVREFINGELVHARLANDHRQMTTADDKGQLPLHHALRNNVRLGSIRLLVRGNPDAIRHADSNGALPLHVACQYHDSPCVVQYLIDLDPTTLQEVDNAGNTALHYACHEAKYGLIGMLLENCDNASVSMWNESGKLPIEVLFESDKVQDRESDEYSDCVFRLLKAYPLALMNFGSHSKDSRSTASSSSSSSLIGMKRKFGDAS